MKRSIILSILPTSIFSFLLLSLIEIVNRASILNYFQWIMKDPAAFLLNLTIYFLLLNCLIIFKNKMYYISISIFSLLLLIFSLISSIKHLYRNEYILPSDFGLGKEAINMSSYMSNIVYLRFFVSISVLLIIIFFLIWLTKRISTRITFRKRLAISAFSLIFLLLFSFFADKILITYENDINKNYESNGLISGFYLLKTYKRDVVKKYNKQVIDNIVNKYPELVAKPASNDTPNIIAIMSEAFWDPTVFKEVKFDEDPLPYFHNLSKNTTSGKLLVPVLGAGTANTEFEFLTGFSTQFLQQGLIPYVSTVHQPVESLASILSKRGYSTTAIHTYHNYFYNRPEVYKDFGFDRFIPMEFLGDMQQIGPYIDDKQLSKKILDLLNNSNKPQFIFGVTMLNHGPFVSERIPSNSDHFEAPVSDSSKQYLKYYTETIREVDKSIKILIDGLKHSTKPTIVVYFGDHLPLLGENFEFYKELGIKFPQENLSEYIKMHSTPLIVWSNYSDNNMKKNITIGSNYLGNYLLNKIGIRGGVLQNFFDYSLKNEPLLLPPKTYWSKLNISNKFLDDYELLQYDMLEGKQYSYKVKPKPSLYYQLGFRKIKLTGTNPTKIIHNQIFNEYNGESILGIYGEGFEEISPYFTSGTQIFINGTPIKTVFSNENYIGCILPREYYNHTNKLNVQVKVIDSKGTTLSQSNILQLTVE